MPLLNAQLVKRMAVNYRFMWLAGRYGGGKTALAYRLAYDLVLNHGYRYILSNVKSVWNDEPEQVQLRAEGNALKADAVLILDEGGEFIASRAEAKQWLAALRKLNVVILLPSVLPPAHDVRFLEVRRLWNGNSIGLPLWHYHCYLESGSISEKISFAWVNPQEIYGIYDTDGYPTDANEILDYVKKWLGQSAAKGGYTNTAKLYGSGSLPPDSGGKLLDTVVSLEGVTSSLIENTRKAERALSVHEKKRRR